MLLWFWLKRSGVTYDELKYIVKHTVYLGKTKSVTPSVNTKKQVELSQNWKVEPL